MNSAARPVLALCLTLGGSAAHAQPASMTELEALAEAVGPAAARQSLAGIPARAEANGPRGAFASAMLSLADGTARFRRGMRESTTDLLIAAGTRQGSGEGTGAGSAGGADAATEAIAYGFTWVELYAAKDGRWQNIGIASSARP